MAGKKQELNYILKHSLMDLKDEGYKITGKKNISRLKILIKEIHSFYEQDCGFSDGAAAQNIVSQVATLVDIKPTLKNADYYMLIMALTGLVGKHGKCLNDVEEERRRLNYHGNSKNFDDTVRLLKWIQHRRPDPDIDTIIESLIANCEKDEFDRERKLRNEIIQTNFPDLKELNQVIDIPIVRWFVFFTHASIRQLYAQIGYMPDFEMVIQKMEISLIDEPIEYAQVWYLWKKTKKLQKKIQSAMSSLEKNTNEEI